ncbi:MULTISPECIES: hypothetical protein [unclassified Streptomyces]|uniref:hypothetical protein n=1 Tax=unclassified Streptomyces TaxID=2593676 RepID=UPI0036A69B2F
MAFRSVEPVFAGGEGGGGVGEGGGGGGVADRETDADGATGVSEIFRTGLAGILVGAADGDVRGVSFEGDGETEGEAAEKDEGM